MTSKELLLLIVTFALLLRFFTGLHSYSGAGLPPNYGDYEAQRHWMELTINLPVSEWYKNSTHNDLSYWGLDYPPLTAYQSYVHGHFMHHFDPASMALHDSKGYETPYSKLLMRWTVVLSDIAVYFPAALAFVLAFYCQRGLKTRAWALAALLLQPALILIDHGHFQFNCISLGLAIAAAAAVVSELEIIASVLFCLSLNHKQMSMYYAPAFFGHLLGVSLRKKYPFWNVVKLGVTVVATFAICWWPFLYSKQSALQVLSRLVPIHRGLYEDYVGNFWCVSSLLIKWKRLYPSEVLVKLALGATVLVAVPSMVQQIARPSKKGFLLAMFNSSLAFYLFSYQVHEKSILLPSIAATMLALDEPDVWRWFMPAALASMFPLLLRDGLLIPYVALTGMFFLVFGKPRWCSGLWMASISLGVALHVGYLLLDPPPRYPFLAEAFLSSYAFFHFILIAAFTNFKQWKFSKQKNV